MENSKKDKIIYEIELYMDSNEKDWHLENHKFCSDKIKEKLFSQFSDEKIDDDSENHANSHLEDMPIDEYNYDSAMESAEEEYNNHGVSLLELKRTMYLSGLGILYHLWDKTLRDFIDKEARCNDDDMRASIWKPPIENIFSSLTKAGWDIRKEVFYSALERCRLVVNAYKHGEGDSFDELIKNDHLQYFSSNMVENYSKYDLGHEHLEINETQFDEFADAISQFWERFPERLYLELPQIKAKKRCCEDSEFDSFEI